MSCSVRKYLLLCFNQVQDDDDLIKVLKPPYPSPVSGT